MASSEQKRKWYPEVVTNHADRGKAGYQPKCDPQRYAVRHTFPRGGGGTWSLWVHPLTVEAWDAYVFLMKRHGETVPSDGGTHNCRNIKGTSWPSLHAYCLALDIPPNNRKSAAFQRDVLAIKTNSGVRVFKNLASANDRMHDEIDCSPAALASGINWSTVAGWGQAPPPPPNIGDDEMALKLGDRGNAVSRYQQGLVNQGYDIGAAGADGIFGPATEAAVKLYQRRADLPQTGQIDGITGALLLEWVPDRVGAGGGITQTEADARYARLNHPHTVTTTIR